MSEELKAAQARIACLEGEIAKRDEELAACRVAVENCDLFRARIDELESRYQRDVYGLNNEGDPIGGDPAGGYANDNARLRTELSAIKAQEPVAEIALSDDGYKIGLLGALRNHRLPIGTKLYAAPVSEAKAKGVVQWPDADEIMQMAFEEGQPADDASGYCFELEEFDLFIERLMSEVARLNAAPAQQVVPDGKVCVPVEVLRLYEFMAASFTPFTSQHEQIAISLRKAKAAMLAAAPAAPAADAGLVEALTELVSAASSVNKSRAHEVRGLQDDEPCYWQRKEWVDWLVTLGERGRDALAAHRAKGVV